MTGPLLYLQRTILFSIRQCQFCINWGISAIKLGNKINLIKFRASGEVGKGADAYATNTYFAS
jgi:uncharacterized Fe-S radical SAM superfamily protein PflX